MLWNWNTIDSCFISSTWRVRSAGMMAGSCIGVILLVMLLELLRRSVKEYDQYLIRRHTERDNENNTVDGADGNAQHKGSKGSSDDGGTIPLGGDSRTCSGRGQRYRPSFLEQAVRALLHTFQFAVAYFVML